MTTRVSTALYLAAIVLTPVSVAAKFLLGTTTTTWVDPTLVLSTAALLLLLPRWEDFLEDDLRLPVAGVMAFFIASLLSAAFGAVLRPPASFYTVLREPLRLWLNLAWFLTSVWFLTYRPRVVLIGSVIAVLFGLGAGIYLDLVAFGVAPAPALAVTYTRAYLIRQTLWFNGFPLLRMGGLFFEAPPFGLFMFSMFVVLSRVRERVHLHRWSNAALAASVTGVLFSLADQVLLAGAVGLFSWLPQLGKRRPTTAWPLAVLVTLLIGAFELQSFAIKQTSSTTGIVTRINGGSVGERDFHLRYGLSLLQAHPAATLFGIGLGRYGEYAGDTGDFPSTVNMQTSEMEILVEWGVAGLCLWIVVLTCIATRANRLHGLVGLGLFVGLIVANSFQANWKHEAVFLATAALMVPPRSL